MLLAETHGQKIGCVGVAHASETLKQPSGTSGRVTRVPAQAVWHSQAPWLISERGPISFSPGRGLAGPTLATPVLTEPVPHHVSAGGDGAWTGSHSHKGLCGKMLCMAGQRAWALLPCLGHPGNVLGSTQGWTWGKVPPKLLCSSFAAPC